MRCCRTDRDGTSEVAPDAAMAAPAEPYTTRDRRSRWLRPQGVRSPPHAPAAKDKGIRRIVGYQPTGRSDTRPLLTAGLTQGGGYTTAEREDFSSCTSIQGHHW